MHDTPDAWISIAEAARRLTEEGDRIERSSLSRYLKQHAEALPLRPAGRQKLVNYPSLKAHRGENIRIDGVDAMPQAAGGDRTDRAQPETPRLNGAARKALAEAEMRELDLAERRGELTPAVEVERAVSNALALMLASFERAVDTEATSLSARFGWDERQVRLALKEFTRQGTDVFHREMLKLIEPEPGAVPEHEDVHPGQNEGPTLQ